MTMDLNQVLTALTPVLGAVSGQTATTTSGGQIVTYKGRKYRQVTTSAGNMLIPYRRSHRIVIGEKGLRGVLALISTGARMARSRGRGGSYSFRRHHRRRW